MVEVFRARDTKLGDVAMRKGLREPVFVTKRGKPVIALMPLTKDDDKVVFIQNFFEELRRVAPPAKR